MLRYFREVLCQNAEIYVAEETGELFGFLALEGDMVSQLYCRPGRTGAGIGARLLALAKAKRPDGLRLWGP